MKLSLIQSRYTFVNSQESSIHNESPPEADFLRVQSM